MAILHWQCDTGFRVSRLDATECLDSCSISYFVTGNDSSQDPRCSYWFVRVFNRLAAGVYFFSTCLVRLGHCVMASLVHFALPFLSLLNDSTATATLPAQNNTLMNATQSATASATPLKMPADFSSLITFIWSFSALHDYFKLIVLGGAFETLRRLYSASYKGLMDRFLITATFESDDSSFRKYPLSLHRSSN